MNTKHSLKMISDHLNDEKTYKTVEVNCDAKVMKGIAKMIEKYKDNLTKKKKRYLTSFSYNLLIQNAIKEQQIEVMYILLNHQT